MLKMYTTIAAQFAALRKDEKGISALEYGVLGAVMIVGIAAAFVGPGGLLGGLETAIGRIQDALNDAGAG